MQCDVALLHCCYPIFQHSFETCAAASAASRIGKKLAPRDQFKVTEKKKNNAGPSEGLQSKKKQRNESPAVDSPPTPPQVAPDSPQVPSSGYAVPLSCFLPAVE